MNNALRAARVSLRMSQDEFAEAIRAAGLRVNEPNSVTKRTVQRWEASTENTRPRASYARALEMVTGVPIESLGFPPGVDTMVVDDGRGGHDLEVRAAPATSSGGARQGNYSGIWLSRYEYYSSGRNAAFTSQHYAVILQHGDRLTLRSLPGSAASRMSMDLTVDGSVITGTWVEETEKDGYYRGARYHGAIQMLTEPSGRRLAGKWVGFGSNMDVNTGPWTLTHMDASTSKATLAQYDRPPND